MDRRAASFLGAIGAITFAACGIQRGDVGSSGTALTPAPFFAGDPANHAEFGVDVSFWETPLAESEMDCFWASGVRHVIVGTQDEGITREQLAMAVSRGMTVDAYVYLYWTSDPAAQMAEAFQRASGFPIGRMWLDIEQNPGSLGATAVDADIRSALTACRAQGTATCGIYTGPGFWTSYTGDTTAFTAAPLWWAEYDGQTSLSSWATEQFAGWTAPVGKQWATKPLCGVGGADWDTIQVTATPTVVVDRSVPPDSGAPPPAPGGLFPSDGFAYTYDYAKVMSSTIPGATSYQIAVERWSGSAWIPYYTWTTPDAFVKFYPAIDDAAYHFQVRAENANGWGAWSSWSWFVYGSYSGPPPAGASAPDGGAPADAGAPPDATPPRDAAPPDAGSSPPPSPGGTAPTGLSPDGDVLLGGSSVTLTCDPVAGATSYQFAIEYESSGGWAPYYAYTVGGPSQTFYPAVHGIGYRWSVRAEVAGAYGDSSPEATFRFE